MEPQITFKSFVKNGLCCCSLLTAVRIIAIFSLMKAVLLIITIIFGMEIQRVILAMILDVNFITCCGPSIIESKHGTTFITLVMLVSFAYLIVSLLLFVSTKHLVRSYTEAWMNIELVVCTAKTLHLFIYIDKRVPTEIVIASIIFIVITLWMIIVVYITQLQWEKRTPNFFDMCYQFFCQPKNDENDEKNQNTLFTLNRTLIHDLESQKIKIVKRPMIMPASASELSMISMDKSIPYVPNNLYSEIK